MCGKGSRQSRENTLADRQCQQQQKDQRQRGRLDQQILIILEAMLDGDGVQCGMTHEGMARRCMHLRHFNIHRMHVQAMALVFIVQLQMPMDERRKDLQHGKPEHDKHRQGFEWEP